MIGNIPRRVGYGLEKFRLVSLHNCDIGFVGATPQFKYESWNFNSGNYLFTTDTK
jgi:hypothetical protein